MENKQLIVICGKGYEEEYARKLMTLLAERKIEAVLWTEQEYLHNRPTISNTEFLIFFGLCSEAKKQAAVISNWDFNMYGAKIGKVGNVCVITAWDGDLSWEELPDFASYCLEKSEKHSDIVIPSAEKGDEIKEVLKGIVTDKGNKSVWRAQYSILIYEFMDNWIDKYFEQSLDKLTN